MLWSFGRVTFEWELHFIRKATTCVTNHGRLKWISSSELVNMFMTHGCILINDSRKGGILPTISRSGTGSFKGVHPCHFLRTDHMHSYKKRREIMGVHSIPGFIGKIHQQRIILPYYFDSSIANHEVWSNEYCSLHFIEKFVLRNTKFIYTYAIPGLLLSISASRKSSVITRTICTLDWRCIDTFCQLPNVFFS